MSAVLDLTVSACQHQEELEEVKRRVGVNHDEFDGWIFNFLENKNFNVEETVAKLHRRADFEQKELAKIEMDDAMRKSMCEGIISLIGDDKEGRCTFYITTRRDKPTPKQREMKTKIFDSWLAYGTRLRESNRRCRITMLINQEGASMWSNTDMAFQSNIALRIAKYYPGVVDRMYLCNMGGTLSSLAKPIFARLPAVVSDRIFIITDAEKKAGRLLELFDEDVLPLPLGGKNDCDNQASYDHFRDTISGYWGQVRQAILDGIPIKEWELQRMRAEAEAKVVAEREEDAGKSIRSGSAFLDDTATMGTCYSDDDVNDSFAPHIRPSVYEESYVEQDETVDRAALVRDEELNRYSLIHRCAHERTALSNMDRVEGGPQVSNAFIKAFPAPARSLVKSILWILAIIMTVYFVTATIYIGLMASGMMGILFFAVFTDPFYIAPLGILTFLFAYQLALITSRGMSLVTTTFRGGLIYPLTLLGAKGFVVQYIIFLLIVVIQFIIFVSYATTVDPLIGIRISFATGWLSATIIIALFHLLYPFGVIDDGEKQEVNKGNVSLFLLFNITEQDDMIKGRKSAIIISIVPVSLALLFGIGFLTTKLLFFLVATPLATALAAITISYFAGERERSSTVPIIRAACWFTCEAWLFAVIAGGTVDITNSWRISIYCNAALAVLFCLFVGIAANIRSSKGTLWCLRIAYVLLAVLFIVGIILSFVLHYGLGIIGLLLAVHAAFCWWRGNSTNLGGYLLVLGGMVFTCLAVILLSEVATPTVYDRPRSYGPIVAQEDTKDTLFVRYPSCLATLQGYTVTDLSLLCEASLATNSLVRDVDLNSWLPTVRYESQLYSHEATGTIHVYSRNASDAKVLVFVGPTEANYIFQSITIWMESMTLIPLSLTAPSSWVTGLVRSISYLHKFIPFPWEDGLTEAQNAVVGLNASKLVITGHAMGGSLAGIVGARLRIPVVAFSSAGLTYEKHKFGINNDDVNQFVMGVQSSNSALSGIDSYGDSTQVLQCTEGLGQCSSIEFYSLTLLKVCPQTSNRTHATLADLN